MIVKIKDIDLAWLAGVLEGDGYFGAEKSKVSRPVISLQMIDRDTVEKVAHIFKEPITQCVQPVEKPHWNILYRVFVRGDKAQNIMEQIFLWMGERRKRKISSILQNYDLKLKNVVSMQTPIKLFSEIDQKILDFYYIAGLLEAEGSFMKGSPSSPNCPRISIQMTDEDVIRKVSNMLGFKYQSYQRKGVNSKNLPYKKVFLFHIKSAPAIKWMKKLHPIMSARRQKQIDNALLNYDPDLRKKMINHNTKLFKKDFETIKEMRANGMSLRTIAEKFNVDHKTVRLTIRDRINK